MDDADEHMEVTLDKPTASLGWRVLLTVALLVLSAVASFAAVRAWRAPARMVPPVSARLTVDTEPTGAELFIDGQPRGKTPQTLSLDPGAHAFTVHAAGAERTVRLTLAPGAHVVHHFELAPSPAAAGRLSIVTDPPGARVAVDGQSRGVSPLLVDDLDVGEHLVSVDSGNGSAERTIAVASGATNEVLFSLARTTAPVAGWLVVTTPFPVDVLEGNEIVGASGVTKVMMAAGRHNVILRNEAIGYAAPRAIEVAPGRVVRLNVVPPQARVNINARPWADVSIDGAPAGQTPLANVSLPIGPHEMTFRHPQYGERTERVTVAANRENRVAIDFTK